MNVASVFALLTGRYMVGALSFSPILKIGPIPTPRHPWINAAPPSAWSCSDPREQPPHLCLIPVATACYRDAQTIECSSQGAQRDRAARLQLSDSRSKICSALGAMLRELEALRPRFQGIERLWQGLDSQVSRFGGLVKWAEDLQLAVAAFQIEGMPSEHLLAHIADLLNRDITRFRVGGQVRIAFETMHQVFPAMHRAAKELGACIGLDRPEDIIRLEPGWIEALLQHTARWKANMIKAPQWATWRAAARAARDAGLSPLVDTIEDGSICGPELAATFDHAWAEAKIKALTGGDRIAARFMRQDFFEYSPQFKLIVVGNHKPMLANVDDAIRRRFKIIPFNLKPPTPDANLEQKLRAEWPMILRWMIDGFLDWRASNGLVTPDSVTNATAAYFADQDLFQQWLDEECDAEHDNPHKWETVADLFDSWSRYANKAGEQPGSKKAFNEAMQSRQFQPARAGKGVRTFKGVRLNVPNDSRAPEEFGEEDFGAKF